MSIERAYSGGDAKMIESGKEKRELFLTYYDDFIAFNQRFLNPPFADDWNAAIDAAETVEKDSVVKDKLKQLTNTVLEKMKASRLKWRGIKYGVEKAYPDNKDKLDEFGADDYPRAAFHQARLIQFMKELHEVSVAHNADLIDPAKGGLTQGQIDEILTLKNELSDANKEQNLYRRGRPNLSNDRVEILNACYAFEADVNEAGKIIFEDDPEMVKLFTYDPSSSAGGGPDPDPNLGSLEGTATVNGYAIPIEGVSVELKQGPNVLYSTTTDENGNYEIVNIALDTYDLVFTADNFSPQMVNSLVFEAESELTEDASLTFLGAIITGSAQDINTPDPLVGASIKGYEDGDPANYIEVFTDANGNYVLLIPISSSTNITLDCNATGYLQEQQSFTIDPSTTYPNTDFSLTPEV